MSSYMPVPHLHDSDNFESSDIPFLPCDSGAPERMPSTVGQSWLVNDAISFPIALAIPHVPVHSYYEDMYSMRPFVSNGLSRRPSGNDDIRVMVERLDSLQRIETQLAQYHGVDTEMFAGDERAEEDLETLYGMKVSVPRFDTAELLERVRLNARLRSDAESKHAVDTLHDLQQLRSKFWSLPQIPHFSMRKPKWMSGPPYRHPDTSRFWAVLIGIDDYESSPLRGAVSDALLMRDYMQKELRMPDTRIECLLSSPFRMSVIPSRQNIIRKLLNLATDTEIEPGDNIIIFFSGHGTSYSFPENPPYDGDEIPSPRGSMHSPFRVEALCPADRGKLDNRGVPIPDISDREINGILRQISRKKGNKITVIVDCCHSGSATRDIQDEVQVREVAPLDSPDAMLEAAHETLSEYGNYQDVFSEDWSPDQSTNVTLAACQGFQFAKETQERGVYNGVFTRSLIDAPRSGHCKKETTYVDLIRALPWSLPQTPIAIGDRKHALLWYRV